MEEPHALGATRGVEDSLSVEFRRAQPEDGRNEWEEAKRGLSSCCERDAWGRRRDV